MTEFLRVRDKHTGHEYDAPVVTINRWPDDYDVLDEAVVYAQRPPVVNEPKPLQAKETPKGPVATKPVKEK